MALDANAVVVGACDCRRVGSVRLRRKPRGGANGRRPQAGGGGMVAQLTFPAEVDATVGGLVNYNPLAAKPLTTTWLYEPLMIRNGITCEDDPVAGHQVHVGGRQQADLRHPRRREVERRPAVHRQGRRLHVQPRQEVPGDRQGRRLDRHLRRPGHVGRRPRATRWCFTFTGNAAPKFDGHHRARRSCPSTSTPRSATRPSTSTRPASAPARSRSAATTAAASTLVRRADYWQADKIKVQKLVLEGNYDASQAALKLRVRRARRLLGRDPQPARRRSSSADPKTNHFWYAPNGITVLTGNTTKAPFNDAKFREAHLLRHGQGRDVDSRRPTGS